MSFRRKSKYSSNQFLIIDSSEGAYVGSPGSGSGPSAPAVTSGRNNDDFDGYATGNGAPTGWSVSGTDTNITFTIATDAGSPGGQHLQIEKTLADDSAVFLTRDIADQSEIAALALVEATDGFPSILINWDPVTESGYELQLDLDSNFIRVWRADSGVYTSLSFQSVTVNPNTKYWMRLMYTPGASGEVKGRFWADGTQEPVTWNVQDNSESTYTSGKTGIKVYSSSEVYTAKYHRFSFGSEGTQGCTMNDADFPDEGVFVLMTGNDNSLRIMEPDGSNLTFLAAGDSTSIASGLHFHKGNNLLYMADQGNTGLYSFNRYGGNRTALNESLTGINTISIDEANGIVYYNVRESSGSIRSVGIDGTGDTLVVSSVPWASGIYFNPNDDLIYISSLNNPRSYNAAGTLQVTFNSDTNNIGIIADDTNMYLTGFSGGDITSAPLAGGSYTIEDSTVGNIWNMSFNGDESEMYAASFTSDIVHKWTAVPPSAGTRSDILTIDQPIAVAYFNII